MVVYYLDTSVLVKRYKTEEGSQFVEELIKNIGPDDILTTSQFTVVEMEATLSRALKARILKTKAYDAVMGRFGEDLGETIVIQPVSSSLVLDAAKLARKHALRAGDAVHLATAMRLNKAALARIILVTSDDELLTSAISEGLENLDPRRSDAIKRLRKLIT